MVLKFIPQMRGGPPVGTDSVNTFLKPSHVAPSGRYVSNLWHYWSDIPINIWFLFLSILIFSVCIRDEHLLYIYRRLIGRQYITLAFQDKINCDISHALGRLRSDKDKEYFSICPNNNTSQCIAEQMRKGRLK